MVRAEPTLPSSQVSRVRRHGVGCEAEAAGVLPQPRDVGRPRLVGVDLQQEGEAVRGELGLRLSCRRLVAFGKGPEPQVHRCPR